MHISPDTFGDSFFDSIDCVTNALDNVAARESRLGQMETGRPRT